MASISDEWNIDKDLPKVLHELLEETEINNSFTNRDMTDQLTESMESSYAYLYRFQRDTMKYKRFHYQTREYLLNTTYNDIQSGLKTYGDKLLELEKENAYKNSDRINELRELITDLGEVRFGDFYLNYNRHMCIEIPFDMIDHNVRTSFRRSPLYMKQLMLSDIHFNPKYFYYIPIIILDDEVRTDVWIQPIEKGTRITFYKTKATDLYTNIESQKFHDINVMFVENIWFQQIVITGSSLKSFKSDPSILTYQYADFKSNMTNSILDREGIVFCSFENFSSGAKSSIIEGTITSSGIKLDMDGFTAHQINEESKSITVTLIFFNAIHRHNFSTLGDVPAINVRKELDDGYTEVPESRIFVPVDSGSNPYTMPIPESNFLIFKRKDPESSNFLYTPAYNVGVTMYYPNLYQINDPKMQDGDHYRVYYFYRNDSTLNYTSLTNFYMMYLKTHFNNKYSLEDIFNLIYFKLPGYDRNEYLIDVKGKVPTAAPGRLENEVLSDFYEYFIKLMRYRDYNYIYGTPDFIDQYTGEDVPLQYKIARMREFVRADYKILRDYVIREQDKTTLYHFFVNSIELRGRFRRSTINEDKYNPIVFAESFEIVDPGLVGSLKVVDKNDYNPKTEIHIKDVKLLLPSVSVGDYVLGHELSERYVFTFKNSDPSTNPKLKVYIDGLLTIEYDTIHLMGMDYIYIPTSSINENSYIIIEKEYGMSAPQETLATFPNSSTWVEFHYITTENLTYTVNDVFIKYPNGNRIDRGLYDIEIIQNSIPYDMIDQRAGETNKYGIMNSIRIRLTNVDFGGSSISAYVVLNKSSFIAGKKATNRGYPRFNLKELSSNSNSDFIRMYYNGRLVPDICYKIVKSAGKEYVQSRIFCEIGDTFLFEFSPYSREVICEIDEFNQNEIFDLSNLIDKPIDPDYYEVFVNGRRLGLPNVFEFGPHHAVFKGLHSKYLLAIYEKERDYEYFGYRQINLDSSRTTHKYYFEPIDLANSSFMSDEELEELIDNYVDSMKHPDAVIEDNVDEEEPILYKLEPEFIQDMKTFYFEELLPLSLGDPNSMQFLKEYLDEVFPCTSSVFGIEIADGTKAIMLDPNITVRLDHTVSNEEQYEVISTRDINVDKSLVLLLGEEDFTDLLIAEGTVEIPVDEYATEFSNELYAVEKIYVEGIS